MQIDLNKLSLILGIPVVGASARSGEGLEKLKEKIYEVAFNECDINAAKTEYSEKIEDAIFTEFSSFYRFFPYIQLHEFETLLYSDLTILEEECFDSDISKLKEEVKMYTNPELINNSPETAPSKRIIRYIHGYDKVKNGVNVVNKIGIDKLCKQCRHFSEWIDKINKIVSIFGI